jgi:predicted RNase H-like HicB family nuclease
LLSAAFIIYTSYISFRFLALGETKVLDLLKRQRTQIYEILAVLEKDDDDSYHGFCPALKGLHTRGRTVDETIENLRNAAIAYLRSLIKHGEPIPVGPFLKEGMLPELSENVITRNITVAVAA